MDMYVKPRQSPTWHWERECSHYPRSLDIEKSRSERPTHDLCAECREREERERRRDPSEGGGGWRA